MFQKGEGGKRRHISWDTAPKARRIRCPESRYEATDESERVVPLLRRRSASFFPRLFQKPKPGVSAALAQVSAYQSFLVLGGNLSKAS